MAKLTDEERSLGEINDDYTQRYGFADPEAPVYRAPEGVSRELIEQISRDKQEPRWMLDFRLKALDHFQARPMPSWGPDLSDIDFEEVSYYIRPVEKQANSWEEVPEEMRTTFDRLGISKQEQELLAGVSLQYDSESIYHQMRSDLEEQGVIFLDTDTALREHPDLVRKWFATAISSNDNKFAALNSAFWSGGSMIYVPPGVEVKMPLQAYFRINSRSMLQAERTLIIADEGAKLSYVEGCSAPSYSAVDSLHAAVVEIIALPGSDVTYFTFQNWDPRTVYNMVTKRAMAFEDATVRWIQCELGSKLNLKYPSVYLLGERAHAEILSVAMAGPGQNQDTGAKAVHAAPHTTSTITSKSISHGGGIASYRGLLEVADGANDCRSRVVCDALLLDDKSASNTWPTIRIDDPTADVGHEATVSKVGDEQLFYLQSRGLEQSEAEAMIVNGFIEPIIKEVPMEYAVEMNRLIQLKMEGSIG